jgi:hypothetical protein
MRKAGAKEEYGFNRHEFPITFREHKLYLLENVAEETVDNRLRLHITIHCPRCDNEQVIRGRLPPEYNRHEYRAALAKLAALGYFSDECESRPNHIHHP